LSMLPGLRSRLLREVRRLVHPDYNVDYHDDSNDNDDENEPQDQQHPATAAPPPRLHIRTLSDPMEASWRGGCRLVNNNNDNHHATTTDPAVATTTCNHFRWCVSSSSGTPSASSTATGNASASLRKQLISEGGYYF
jgi:hypothetical protein